MISTKLARGAFLFALQLLFLSAGVSAVSATECVEESTENANLDKRPTLVAVLGEDHYGTVESVPKFAKKFLGDDFRVKFVTWEGVGTNRLPGIEALDEADVVLLSVRRCTPKKEQLDAVRRYVASGKPLVALRTSSHAFCLGKKKPAAKGNDEWPTFDREVLGCHYTGHAPTRGKNAAPTTTVVSSKENASHPILKGVAPGPRVSDSWLYYSRPLGGRTKTLITAQTPQGKDGKEAEPVAWTNITEAGGKVFYASLGSESEFKDPNFQRMLLNALRWAADSSTEDSPSRP